MGWDGVKSWGTREAKRARAWGEGGGGDQELKQETQRIEEKITYIKINPFKKKKKTRNQISSRVDEKKRKEKKENQGRVWGCEATTLQAGV